MDNGVCTPASGGVRLVGVVSSSSMLTQGGKEEKRVGAGSGFTMRLSHVIMVTERSQDRPPAS